MGSVNDAGGVGFLYILEPFQFAKPSYPIENSGNPKSGMVIACRITWPQRLEI